MSNTAFDNAVKDGATHYYDLPGSKRKVVMKQFNGTWLRRSLHLYENGIPNMYAVEWDETPEENLKIIRELYGGIKEI
jgi:hypothetical protein